jgi:uncharacterized protein (DUF58 family)
MSLRRNALLLAVLAGLMAIVAAWSSDPALAGGFWRLPLGLLLLGLAYERWLVQRLGLQAKLTSATPSFLGKRHAIELQLTHAWHRPVYVEIALDAPEAVELERTLRTLRLAPGVGGREVIATIARRLGSHPWPVLRLRAAGVLGLAWWTRQIRVDFALRVIPDLLDAAARRMGAVESGQHTAVSAGVGLEVLQLREYRPGDPQHRIDWKASARTGQLVSRDFSEDQHLEIVLAIDAGRSGAVRAGGLERLGHYANLAARFAENAVLQDDRVGLLIFADRPLAACAPMRGLSAVLRIRHMLSSMQVVRAESNPLNAVLRIRSLVRHRSLVIMLTDLDDATVASQLATAARMLLPKHLPLIVGLASREVEELAQAPASNWLAPYEALAAQEYSARLHRNVLALRALGAPAIMPRPEQLERAVFEAYAEFRRRRRV